MLSIVTRIALIGCGAVLALTLAACSSEGEAASEPNASEADRPSAGEAAEAVQHNEVVIVESGWSADDQGYIHYGIVLENRGKQSAQFPAVTITGKDADGNVVSSDEQVLMELHPGQTASWGGQAGTGTAPETVEFNVSVSERNWIDSPSDATAFEISGTTAQDSGFGTVNFVGEIANLHESADYDSVAVSVLLRDEAGAIVAGYTGFARNLTAGSTTSFDVFGYGIPAYATFEVTAQPWI
ncbi:hypothetical protein [Raoultibacter phocaeensis]|uniref:hypothetical protein n=1 Tax=Raoultibacter phocaeensis TaxID=2479841 RepID=UPI001119F64C|nr:hypothetical protein [Raoultibacter phocaeensis]